MKVILKQGESQFMNDIYTELVSGEEKDTCIMDVYICWPLFVLLI